VLSSCSCLRALQAYNTTVIGMQCIKREQCVPLDALQACGWSMTKSMFSTPVQV